MARRGALPHAMIVRKSGTVAAPQGAGRTAAVRRDLMDSSFLNWGMVMAAGVTITLPAPLFFAFVQGSLVSGWGAGTVNG